MKQILLIISVFCLGFPSQSQEIEIFDSKGKNIIGDTIIFNADFCNVDFEVFEKKGFAKVVNASSGNMVIGLRRHEENVVPGTGDAVCWGSTCFGERLAGTETVWDVPDSATVGPMDTATGLAGFVTYHYPNGNVGESLYKYEFYDRSSLGVSASFHVKYVVATTVDKLEINDKNKESIIGDTIILEREIDPFDDFQTFEVKGLATILNINCEETTIGLRRIERGVVSGTGDAVCWGSTCFGERKSGVEPTWDVPDSAVVSPFEEAAGLAGFVVYHFPNKRTGESLYEYQFYDRDNSSGLQSSVFVKVITTVQAPKIKFANSNTSNAAGDTLEYTIDVDGSTTQEFSLNEQFFVVNYSTSSLNIGVSRAELSTVSGAEESFCWADSCSMKILSGSNSNVTFNKSVSVNAGDSVTGNDVFKTKIYPNDNFGTILHRYDFFDMSDPSIKSSIYIEYSLEDLVGINESELNQSDFTIFPNPADDLLKFSVSDRLIQKKPRMIIKDLLGKTVLDQQLNTVSRANQLDVSALTPGVYFVIFSLEEDNQITKKLIIK